MITKPIGMNTLIAEHVFGWKWDKHWAGGCWIIPNQYRDWDCGEPQCTPPNFTEDISDAWQVVEKMRSQGFNAGVQHPCVQHEGKAFVYFHAYTGGKSGEQFNAIADTAPLAICLAALKAVGVEVDSPK